MVPGRDVDVLRARIEGHVGDEVRVELFCGEVVSELCVLFDSDLFFDHPPFMSTE